jgi:tryptophanyl-tRNA synthetase
MARDMAHSFNHRYGEHFVPPQAVIEEEVATLPGLDGRKMSKSYDNTIPLFSPREQLKKLIAGIKTDSRNPGEPKDTEGSALFQIYQAFASKEETQALRNAFAAGIAWGDAKQQLFERIDREIAPMRETYEQLMNDPARIEKILKVGAQKARAIASPFMAGLRHAVGLRNLQTSEAAPIGKASKSVAHAQFKQYREKDGKFYFKLVDTQGTVLLQSLGFDSPKVAGQSIALLQQKGGEALSDLHKQLAPISESERNSVAAALVEIVAAKA